MILVTGATGFIGSEILRRGSRRGWRIRGLSRHPDRAEALGRLPHVELFRGDVSTPADLEEAMEGVAAVVHLVGIIHEGNQSFEEAHVQGTRRVLEAARSAGVERYVHMSALGAEQGRGLTDYFDTKWRAEELVRDAPLEATIFRPSVVFGPDDEFTNRLATIAKWSPVVFLPGGGKQRMQPIWVGDVAECFLQAARMEASPRETYEMGGPEVLTVADMVRVLLDAMGRSRRPVAPVPVGVASIGAAVMESAPGDPLVTRAQLKMLEIESVPEEESLRALIRDFEFEHARLAEKAPAWLN
ncbi:MAG: complex I NDUFA9 subunit family protein [Gemmatimonadota bacterium]|nr:complex I NDUFA9 subunit family protein [Gemmatimonadota bacterium]